MQLVSILTVIVNVVFGVVAGYSSFIWLPFLYWVILFFGFYGALKRHAVFLLLVRVYSFLLNSSVRNLRSHYSDPQHYHDYIHHLPPGGLCCLSWLGLQTESRHDSSGDSSFRYSYYIGGHF